MEHPIVKKHLEASASAKSRCGSFRKKSWRSSTCPAGKGRAEPDGSWAASASDRQPCCAVSGIFRPGGPQKVQVFEDFGAGYTPEHSYYQYDAYEADDLINARIICKAGTKAIRLDPAELPCLVQIHGIEWRGKALTRAQLDQCLSTNGQVLARYPVPCSRRYCLKQEIRTSAFGWIVWTTRRRMAKR